MDSDQGKLFIGGISWETDEDRLKDYFSQYGDVLQAVVMRDKLSGRPRGFGFVVFADPLVLDSVLQNSHSIDGRTVEAKRALSREEQQTNTRSGIISSSRNSGHGGNIRTKKIFVGGLPSTLTDEQFRQYFEAYGHVTDVVIMYDQNTQRPRGFGFICFDNEDAVDQVLQKTFHDLNGKQVEVKRALPKDANPSGGRAMSGGSAGGGSSYHGFGASGGNSVSYDRMDSSRYMQTQNATGGFPPYASSGYGTGGYGYGSTSNGVGYPFNYGGAGAGFGAGAPYGNLNVANAGYPSGHPGGPRGSQAHSGYGSMGYSSASWGAPASGPSAGGPGSVPIGQSPGSGTRYGTQGYGYYGANDGSYGNPAGYGIVGGHSTGSNNSVGDGQGSGSAYMGGSYGDSIGNPGYGNAHWRSEPPQSSGNYGHSNGPHAGQMGYGGYGVGQPRQSQQQ